MGADRVAVIVCCGDRSVTPDLLRGLSDALIATYRAEERDTHAGLGYHGRYDYWCDSDWLMPAPDPTADEVRPCPRCGGSGAAGGTDCPVCRGQPWRAVWDFGVGHPVEWVRAAIAAGRVVQRPNYVLAPDGRLYPCSWFDRALAEFPACWVVPMSAGL